MSPKARGDFLSGRLYSGGELDARDGEDCCELAGVVDRDEFRERDREFSLEEVMFPDWAHLSIPILLVRDESVILGYNRVARGY